MKNMDARLKASVRDIFLQTRFPVIEGGLSANRISLPHS